MDSFVRGLAHIGIPAKSARDAGKWYRDILGFTIEDSVTVDFDDVSVDVVHVAFHDVMLELFSMSTQEEMKEAKNGVFDSIFVYIRDIEALFQKLSLQDIHIQNSEITTLSQSAFGPVYLLSIVGINNEKIVFVEKKNEETSVEGLAGVKLFVQKLENAVDYYTRFGFKKMSRQISFSDGNGILIGKGGMKFVLFQPEKWPSQMTGRGSIDHIAFDVANINDVYHSIVKKNISLIDQEIINLPSVWGNGVRYFMANGAGEEVIEFNQRIGYEEISENTNSIAEEF